MTRPLRFDDRARQEILAARSWYERKEPGLGDDFRRVVAAAAESIQRDPLRFAVRSKAYRSCHLRRFPYALHYEVTDTEILVLACLHFRQSPDRWPGA